MRNKMLLLVLVQFIDVRGLGDLPRCKMIEKIENDFWPFSKAPVAKDSHLIQQTQRQACFIQDLFC